MRRLYVFVWSEEEMPKLRFIFPVLAMVVP